MRMPYAKTRKNPALNKAYAYVVSPYFGEAAAAIVEKLKNKGFDDSEALASIQQEPPKTPDINKNWNTPYNQYTLSGKLKPADIPSTIQFTNGDTLFFTPETTDEDIKKLCKKLPLKEVADVIWKFENYKKTDHEPSPASQGIVFTVPRLMFKVQKELLFAEPDTIFAVFDWNIADYAEPRLLEHEFNIGETGKGFVLDIDGNRLKYSAAERENFLPNLVDTDIWNPANLCCWLDRKLKQEDIPQTHMLEWLRCSIEYLMDTRKIPLSSLIIAKYALMNKLLSKIYTARQKAKNTSFALFLREGRKTLDYKNPFPFTLGMYEGLPVHEGSYKFTKHFLGNNKIPAMDDHEEIECAKAIDQEPQVRFWLRNVARHNASFKLPTATDFFYPDFIARLVDDRILVVEYKGAHLAETPDTKEKVNIGEIWAKVSKNKALFLLATIKKGGKRLEDQIREKIGKQPA